MREYKPTCGYCLKQFKPDPSRLRQERAGQPICPDCAAEWDRCFPTQHQERQAAFDFMSTAC